MTFIQFSGDAINSHTYKQAGVDIAAGDALVQAIKPLAAATARPGAGAGLGGFAGLFDLKAAGFADPLLLAATDGVGTKLKLAVATQTHDGVGIDLVAMCVNDLVVQGAEPLLFLDYFATGRLDVDVGRSIVAGIADGCRQAGCALIGGETAELPGMYAGGDYDLAGFAVGAVERGALVTGADIAAGDVILGLASTGLHSNGFSLVRRVVDGLGLPLDGPAPFEPSRRLGDGLLTPTRIYVRGCLAGIAAGGVRGLCHVTGGGIVENLPRVLPDDVRAEIDGTAWPAPAVFGWLAREAGIADDEMLRTFNCGVGMIAIVDPACVAPVRAALAAAGETVWEIGRVAAADGPGSVHIEGLPWPR